MEGAGNVLAMLKGCTKDFSPYPTEKRDPTRMKSTATTNEMYMANAGFALGATQILKFVLGVTQMLAFLDTNMSNANF